MYGVCNYSFEFTEEAFYRHSNCGKEGSDYLAGRNLECAGSHAPRNSFYKLSTRLGSTP